MYNQSGQNILRIIFIASATISIGMVLFILIGNVQKKTRDQERITTITKTKQSLELYHDTYQKWPTGDDDGKGWDEGFHSPEDKRFIQELIDKR